MNPQTSRVVLNCSLPAIQDVLKGLLPFEVYVVTHEVNLRKTLSQVFRNRHNEGRLRDLSLDTLSAPTQVFFK